MGRRKKIESAVLVKLVEDYYTDETNGGARKMKYSELALYAQAKGVPASWYDFRRDKRAKRRIDELSASGEKTLSPGMAAYKTLDIDALLNGCRTTEELKRKLCELDGYWRAVYDGAVREKERSRELSAKALDTEKERTALEHQAAELRKENTYLRKMLRENLYPAVANELLRNSHLPAPENDTVPPEALLRLIEPETPRPLDGVQPTQAKNLSRQEQILADMREQVKRHE